MKTECEIGDVFQIHPDHDSVFGGTLLIVTEPLEWGAMGYILFEFVKPDCVTTYKNRAFYRCKYENMEYVGKVKWMSKRYDEKS